MSIPRLELDATLPAAVLSLAAGIVLLPFHPSWLHAVGYCLSCPIPFVLVVDQRRAARNIQLREGRVRGSGERSVAAGVLLVGFIVAGVHAWLFSWGVS